MEAAVCSCAPVNRLKGVVARRDVLSLFRAVLPGGGRDFLIAFQNGGGELHRMGPLKSYSLS